MDESITFIKAQQEQITTVTEHLEAVKAERDQLLAELNQWRGSVSIEPRQVTSISQSGVHHGDTSVSSDTILGAVPTALRSANPAIPIIGETAPSFITNPANPTALPADSNVTDMPWESFESRIHNFGTHPNHVPQQRQGESRPNNSIGSPDAVQLASYQTSRSPNMSQFNTGHEQHDAVFMPFQPPQTFNPGGFQTDGFIQNPLPLQDYIPP